MANENETLDSLNEETELDANIELDALKTKHQETVQKNKQLFERAKKAESDLKELRAKPEPPKEPVKPPEKSDDFGLLQKTYLRAAGVTSEDEVELAKDVQKKTGLEWDKLVDDDYFKSKLEGLRTAKANAAATANIRGDGGGTPTKETPEYWAGKIAAGDVANLPDNIDLVAKAAEQAANQARGKTKTFYDS